MGIDILQTLVREVEKALGAGIDALHHNTTLQKSIHAVHQLATDVPSLQPLIALLAQLATAPVPEKPALLLRLHTQTRLISVTLANHAIAGHCEPFAPGPTWVFASGNVHHVLDAIQQPDACRTIVVENGIRQGHAFDCRLIDAALDGLQTLTGTLAKLLAERILPTHGRALLPELQRRFARSVNPSERKYLLQAACRIDPHAMATVCRELAQQPTSLTAEAIGFLYRVAPEAAAEATIRQRAHFNNPVLTLPMVRSLRYTTDAQAVRILLDALSDTKLSRAALRVLATKNLAAYQRALASQLSELDCEELNRLVGLMVESRNEGLRSMVPAILQRCLRYLAVPHERVHQEAAETLIQLGHPEGLHAVANLYQHAALRSYALRAMWALPPTERYERLAPLLEPALRAGPGTCPLGDQVFALFERPATRPRAHQAWDDRWVTLFLRHLSGPRRYEIVRAMRVVGVGNTSACARLCAHLETAAGGLGHEIAQTLGVLGDPSAIATLANKARTGHIVMRQACIRALGQLGAETAVRAAFDDPWEDVRKTAIKTLVRMHMGEQR